MDKILQTPIIGEVEQSFLDYGVSVITDRAIPSIEDGLKPVQRRILWDMFVQGNLNNKKFVKCAQPVGDTMGRFHPHGDSSIYGALVYMAQPWSMRYPLITFHGNYGSRDGDSPAAYRYTECKLSKIGEETLSNIKKDSVDWIAAYTNEENEPVYLPGQIPNLLINGTTGIAVALATSWAPHNLTEIMDAIIHNANHPEATIDDLLQYIKGPDFPTGGLLINADELSNAYKTGRGRARVRAEYKIETDKNKTKIVFCSLPYKVSKESLTEDIDKLCEEGKINGIASIRDESSQGEVRFVIELNKDVNASSILNKLFKMTRLEDTYSFNQVALVNKSPKLLNLKESIELYIGHQKDVLSRSTQYDLNKVQAKLHILAGLLIALEDIDNIIALIKSSESAAAAKTGLMAQYKLSEEQAKAILDMKLSRLAKLEKVEVNKEKNDLIEKEKELQAILSNPIPELIKLFTYIKEHYGDVRRTTITQINEAPEDKEIAYVEPEKCVVILTESGNIKRIPTSSFRTQKRNGKGVKTQDDITSMVLRTNTIDSLMVFTNKGRMYRLLVDNIPVGTNVSTGAAITSLIEMEPNEKPTIIYSIYRDTDAQYVLFTTKNGLVKKTALEEYIKTKKKTGMAAITIREGDELVSVSLIKDELIILLTNEGMGIQIKSTDITASGRIAQGMKGISLKENDYVVASLPVRHITDNLAIFHTNGTAKKFPVSELPVQNRGGKGLKTTKEHIACAALIEDTDTLLVCGDTNSLCVSAGDITSGSRISVGTQVIKGNKILSVSKV